MKTKTKIKRYIRKNNIPIIIISIIFLIGIAANINILLLPNPVFTDLTIIKIQKSNAQTLNISDNNNNISVKEQKKPLSVEAQIREIAKKENFKWPDYLVRLAKAESSLNPNAINKNKNGTIDRGLFQWNDKLAPMGGISDECAFNVECSTIKTMEAINAGYQERWMKNNIASKKCDTELINNK